MVACSQPTTPSATKSLPRLERQTVTIPTSENQPILILRAALIERAGLPGVFILNDEGIARFRLVRPAKIRGDYIEISSGLRSGETLVVGGLNAVRDGSPISTGQQSGK